jgi:hypothetical protein
MKGWKYQTSCEEQTNTQRAALNQLHTLKALNNKNNSMAGITTYLSILTLNVEGLSSPVKRQHLANWIKKEDPKFCCLQETHFINRNNHWLRVKSWKTIYQVMAPQNRQK